MKAFVRAADAIAATPRKTEKVRVMADLFRSLSLADARLAALFLTGRAFPQREERILGVGGAALAELVLDLSQKAPADLSRAYRDHGDFGDAAASLLDATGGRELTLREAESLFSELAEVRGKAQKADLLRKRLGGIDRGDVKYIVKIMTGDLRIGSKESLVEEGIAQAFDGSLADVRRANMLLGDIGDTLQLASENRLSSASLRMFHPIGFMLSSPVESASELFEGEEASGLIVEAKYDGIRAQVHKTRDSRVRIFSRTLDEVQEFPELLPAVAALPGEFVLDGEILGWRDSRPLPFTTLQSRLGRKQLDLWIQRDVPVRFLAFDLLYQDGSLLLDAPLSERKSRLGSLLPHSSELLAASSGQLCAAPAEVERLFRESLAGGFEGIVAKRPDSPYLPGRRGGFWFKWKEALATLDVVVTAVEYGNGKRHKVLSDYTFAVRDGKHLLNIGKAYSGLTDQEIAANMQEFLKHTIREEGHRLIVEPRVVLEVAFNNIQRSKRHASGFALRFPRIVRLRPDKLPAEIDTLDQVERLFAKQGAFSE